MQFVARPSCFSKAKGPRHQLEDFLISNGNNRNEWSPIRSVIIRVITKSDDRATRVQFAYHEVLLSINHKNYNFQGKKNSQVI